MITPRLVLCSGIQVSDNDARRNGREVIELDALGHSANVYIRLEQVAKVFLKHLSPRLIDLIEIAAYIYSADCSTKRGTDWTQDNSVEAWGRDFHFVIPVRDVKFWRQTKVKDLLCRLLKLLADDTVKFDFESLIDSRPVQGYLDFTDASEWPFYGVERVLMFSGGLDSLAGAIETAAKGEKLVLVSHRPVGTMTKRQRTLFKQLKAVFLSVEMLHIPVCINKDKNLGREHTQRTRSFLYAALGVVVAMSVNAKGVRFFENGIISLNLPVADEVLRARASRTTHPQVIKHYSELYSLVTDQEFIVDNPYIFKTKTEVVSLLAQYKASSLIQYTCSCAHTGFFQE